MTISSQDLALFDVPDADDKYRPQDLKDTEALLLALQEENKEFVPYLEQLHATFTKDQRMVHMLTPKGRSVYFDALSRLAGSDLADVITAPKKKTKAQKQQDLVDKLGEDGDLAGSLSFL